ncbi:MAG: hypothetical protein P4M00_13430 [Azospirillaceae bacterium]|nr:hypothetical protein [Azospirillaceae bacterium]
MRASRGRSDQNAAMVPDAVLTNALLGGGLPAKAERQLQLASRNYHRDGIAEGHLRQAQAIAPEHAAVLIGLYRFYFYKGRLADALDIARLCLAKAARDSNFPGDWRLVTAADAEFGSYDKMLPRFYLFTLKGYAYLQMRLGNIEEGRAAAAKLLELDPSDKIGAQLLLDIIQRRELDDHE